MADKMNINQNQPLAPLSLSNLQESVLEDHVDGLHFDQNTVPFDFDGQVLIWLVYLEGGLKEIKTYSFEQRKVETVVRFAKAAGIISHVKIAKPKNRGRDQLQIFYVQNTKDVVMYDSQSKVSRLIGTVSEPILALNVVDKQTREDLEEQKVANFIIAVVDDSETISIFDTEKTSVKPAARCTQKINKAAGFPEGVADRAWFGMGYPYQISSYGHHVAVSTDWGILVFKY